MGSSLTITGPVERDGVSIIQVSGRLDAEGAVTFREYCGGYRAVNDKPLLIDLAGVTFVASSGVGTLLVLTDAFSEAGKEIAFYNLSEVVDQVVDFLNLQEFLCLASSLEEALILVHHAPDTA